MASAWTGDACSLVDAYRAGTTHPSEVLEECLRAMDASELNAFSHTDPDVAREAARRADVSLPFGGVPVGIKELEYVKGWPDTHASLVLADNVAPADSTQVTRLRAAGAVIAAQTTSPEFGGVNYTRTRLHGTTRNPWDPSRTPGGSSGGSAAAVAGGLLPLCSGSDGGGSIRIPAGFSGLVGLKATYGRIPRGPRTHQPPLTVTVGCLSRSVRDTARWFDVCNGFDARDSLSLPRVGGWEAGLGTRDLAGTRVLVDIDLGAAIVEPRVAALLTEVTEALIAEARLTRVSTRVGFPLAGREWSMSNAVGLAGTLGDRYPACASDLTPEIRRSLETASQRYTLAAAGSVEAFRVDVAEHMADVFESIDVIIAATNPDVAFAAEGPMPLRVGDVDLVATYGFGRAASNNGALTIPANLTGHPAISVPAGTIDGLPVGMQIIARHHEEPLLLELARRLEQMKPWPLVAPPASVTA